MPKNGLGNGQQIAVIGAGVIGCSIAWSLCKRASNVVLFDEYDKPFRGISSAGFGSLTPFSDPFYRGEAREFAAKAVGIYRQSWLHELTKASGQPITFCDRGLIQLCQDTKDIAHAKDIMTGLAVFQHEARILTAAETREMEPNLTGDFLASLWMNEPWLDRDQYYTALGCAIANSKYIQTYYGCAIRQISADRNHDLVLHAQDGRKFKCSAAVVCNGLHTNPIDGVPRLPLRWIRGDAIAMYSTDGCPLLQRHVYFHDGFITPRAHSEMLLGATYHEEYLPPENSRLHRDRIALEQFEKLIAANLAILPSLAKCEIGKVWRNWRPAAPDNYPILGAFPDEKRIVIANGFIGLGLTLAPAVAEAVARYFVDAMMGAFPNCFAPCRKTLKGE